MTQESKGPPLKPVHVPRSQAKDSDKPKEKSEAAEIAGRHKNSGQKDHKGAR
jgi:outer membrane biosynthesis protein TonB